MDMQNVKKIEIPEGQVKTIHDKDNRLLWGAVGYDTKYAGDTFQQTYSGKNLFDSSTLTAGDITGDNTTTRVCSYQSLYLQAGTYTFSTNLTSPFQYYITTNSVGGAPQPSYPSYAYNSGWKTTSSVTFTINTAGYLLLTIGRQNGTALTVNDVIGYEYQLESGNQATSWEKFVGGTASPNPDYPQDIQVVTGAQTISITDGANTQNFTIDLGSTELAKIGNYQDYIYKSGDDWYVHKATGKYTFTGSETIGKAGNANNNSYYYSSSQNPSYGFADIDKTGMESGAGSTTVTPSYSNHFIAKSSSQIVPVDSIGMSFNTSGASNLDFRIGVGLSSSLNTAQLLLTWLANNPTSVYYPLATPTNTKITDATLISQLEAIHQWLTRYGYNATVSGNLPMIVDRTNL